MVTDTMTNLCVLLIFLSVFWNNNKYIMILFYRQDIRVLYLTKNIFRQKVTSTYVCMAL